MWRSIIFDKKRYIRYIPYKELTISITLTKTCHNMRGKNIQEKNSLRFLKFFKMDFDKFFIVFLFSDCKSSMNFDMFGLAQKCLLIYS